MKIMLIAKETMLIVIKYIILSMAITLIIIAATQVMIMIKTEAITLTIEMEIIKDNYWLRLLA